MGQTENILRAYEEIGSGSRVEEIGEGNSNSLEGWKLYAQLGVLGAKGLRPLSVAQCKISGAERIQGQNDLLLVFDWNEVRSEPAGGTETQKF